MSEDILVEFDNLHVHFPTIGKPVEAVRGVTFHINKGETVGVVGESGSGKSVSAMSLLRLNDTAGAYMPEGRIFLHSSEHGRVDITEAEEPQMQSIRGKEVAMIFQEPMTCLNPVLSIKTQLTEPLLQHQGMSTVDAEEKVLGLLRRVRIPDPEKKLDQYPHHLSGGMRQRAMIAMALCCEPALLIADEPTTALDVTIQAQILDLIKDLQGEFGMSVMFITHDMAVIAEMADRVVVMFNGEVVEQGPVDQIFHAPQQDYTKKLINAVPRIGSMTGVSSPEKFPLAAE
jgi:ABC-type dipeptide/oligopeptide/nickel transport system ATPase component